MKRLHRSLAAAAVLFGSAPAQAGSSLPPVALGAPGGAAALNAGAQVFADQIAHPVVMSQRAQLGGFQTNAITAGIRSTITSRMWEQVPAGPGVVAIRLVFSGYYSNQCTTAYVSNGNCETPAINPVTYAAAVEYNTTPGLNAWAQLASGYQVSPPFTVKGQTSWTVPPYGTVTTDWLYLNLAAGQSYYIKTAATDSVGGRLPVRVISRAALYEGSNSGLSPSTTMGTGNGSATSFSYTWSGTYLPIVPGTMVFTLGSGNVTDNGSGGCPASNGVASCTVNYTTGAVTITTSAAVANGTNIVGSVVGGAAAGDQTLTNALNPFNYQTSSILNNPMVGPVAVEGLPASNAAPRMRTIAVLGDSIHQGSGNITPVVATDTSYLNYIGAGRFGIAKGAVAGERVATWADVKGRIGRMPLVCNTADRLIDDAATNDISTGTSLSRLVDYFLLMQPVLAGCLPHGASDLWWVTVLPRVVAAGSTTYYTVLYGPYAGSGAGAGPGFGPGPVTGGVRSATLTGDGTTTTFAGTMPGAPLLPGSLWAYGGGIVLFDDGAGGTGSSTLSGTGVTTGTINATTGAYSITLSSPPAAGKTIELDAYSAGASERNAWNHFLFNWAVPKKLLGGVLDTASCVENNPGSATGTGDGLWKSATDTSDGTHPATQAHTATIPNCIGPNGTTPSVVWTFPS